MLFRSIYIISKGDTSGIALYRFQANARPGTLSTLERVGQPLTSSRVREHDWITAATLSSDGLWVALRTHKVVMFYRAGEFLRGIWNEVARAEVGSLDEAKGEGVALAAGNTLFLTAEGGGGGRPGTFWRLSCPSIDGR